MPSIKAKDAKRMSDQAKRLAKEEKQLKKQLSPVFKRIQKACDGGFYIVRVETLTCKEQEYLIKQCGYKLEYLFDQVYHYHYTISWD